MSDTPETDEAYKYYLRENDELVDSEIRFARKLERERDEANEELHKQLVRYDQLFDEAEKIRIERDEVRTELEEAQLCLKKAITELDLASVEIFKWERDFMIVVNDFKTVVKQLKK